MLPLIGARLVAEVPDLVPRGFLEDVMRAMNRARAQNMALDAATVQVTRALAESGIPALPLKGPRLAEAAHGDLGLRSSNDIDLLVPTEALDQSVALLRTEGYEAPTDPIIARGLPHLHYELRHPTGPSVELHWRVHWYEERFSADLLRAARPDESGVLTATSAGLAACLLLFLARDGLHGLRMTADIAAWNDSGRGALGAGALDETCREYPALARPLEAAARVAERFSGVPRAAWLSPPASDDRRIGLACRLADWSGEGDRDQMKANISLVDGLLAPRGGSPAFMRRQVFTTEEARWPVHSTKMLARYALGLAQARYRMRTPAPISSVAV